MKVIVLAAGQGKRMRSVLPKVLQPLAAKPLLAHVLDTARALQAERIVVVYGHGGEVVRDALDAPDLAWARQDPPQGTGHAVQQAMPHVEDGDTALILYGDVPLIGEATLRRLVGATGPGKLALLTVGMDDPTGYGRILRGRDGAVQGIVEHKDATPQQREIREIYTGIMAAPTGHLKRWVGALKNNNVQGEYYLTDIVAMAVAEGVPVVASPAPSETEVLGVNSPLQLADLERRFQRRQADVLLEAAVWDPAAVSRTQRRLHLVSEAGRRYERAVDPAISVAALDRCAALLAEIAGGTAEHRLTDWRGDPPRTDWSPPPVRMPTALPDRTAGLAYSDGTAVRRLTQIGATVASDGDDLVVTPPSWRPDLVQPADLVEEVLRLEGLDKIGSVLPTAPAGRGLTAAQRRRRAVGKSLALTGFVEVLTSPFVAPAVFDEWGLADDDPRRRTTRVLNPLESEKPALATTLLPAR